MLRMKVKEESDGSKRLFICACRCVDHDLSDSEAIATIRKYEKERPFPCDRSDDEILERVRSAEKIVQRGISLELSNGCEYESEELDKDGNPKIKIAPLSMGEVIDGVKTATDNWPRRIGSALFIDDKQHGIGWFEKQASLFGCAGIKIINAQLGKSGDVFHADTFQTRKTKSVVDSAS